VDTKTDAAIRKAMATEMRQTTKIIIAQRVASVEDADQIIMLDDGRIQAVGNHQQLLQSCPRYQELYTAQLRKEERA
jgi:ATP-binding cassette subfamily B protein